MFRLLMAVIGLWFDWMLFGNGKGMKSPYFSDIFYWIDGHFYQWIGGSGAQLCSREWRMPNPGTRRTLLENEMVVYTASRKGPRVSVSWRLTKLNNVNDINKENELIREFKIALESRW